MTGFWDNEDLYLGNALREFDESEPIFDVIAAQVSRSTGCSGGGCSDPSTSIVQTYSNACHLPDHVVISRRESKDALKIIFAERGWGWHERDSGVLEFEPEREYGYGIFVNFRRIQIFYPTSHV